MEEKKKGNGTEEGDFLVSMTTAEKKIILFF